MCGSEELIHDARQITLEEMIMTNETPMYLVPGRLTDEEETNMRSKLLGGPILGPADMFSRMVGIVGTPIQPCADVETACWITPGRIAFLRGQRINPKAAYASAGATPISTAPDDVPFIRRTDMEAQVARVAAEKDGEIARLRNVLTAIASREIGDSPAPSQAHIAQLEWDIEWCQRKARAALNEGSAG